MSRTDDNAAAPIPGMLRYAVQQAADGSVITFDPALNGQTIKLDAGSPNNHIKITRQVTIQGPGSSLLSISGGGGTRIFLIAATAARIGGLSLADGLGKGGDGGSGVGGAGGGGGAAGMGGAIVVHGANLILDGVLLTNNRAEGGSGGYGGANFAAGAGGAGGGFGGNGASGPRPGGGGDLAASGAGNNGIGGAGGASASSGEDGGWGGGGGGGGFGLTADGGAGGSGGPSGFGGGIGGAGGFFDGDGNSVPGRGGAGGAGVGGAVFVSSGLLQLVDSKFEGNRTAGGAGASGAANGQAKGGALFVCSSGFCGPGHDAAAVWYGRSLFEGNSAADAGLDERCPGRDDADVCGSLSAPVPARFRVSAPVSVKAGEPFSFTITALDAHQNLVLTYVGPVRLAITDGRSVLPLDATLSRGVGVFSVTLKTAGRQTISASDNANASISGTSSVLVEVPVGSS